MIELRSWWFPGESISYFFQTMEECIEFRKTVSELIPKMHWAKPYTHKTEIFNTLGSLDAKCGLSGAERAHRDVEKIRSFADKQWDNMSTNMRARFERFLQVNTDKLDEEYRERLRKLKDKIDRLTEVPGHPNLRKDTGLADLATFLIRFYIPRHQLADIIEEEIIKDPARWHKILRQMSSLE